jgi:hypothetical protein
VVASVEPSSVDVEVETEGDNDAASIHGCALPRTPLEKIRALGHSCSKSLTTAPESEAMYKLPIAHTDRRASAYSFTLTPVSHASITRVADAFQLCLASADDQLLAGFRSLARVRTCTPM